MQNANCKIINETHMPYKGTKEDEDVIPAVIKRESRNKSTGCPIKNFGHDERGEF